MNDPEKIWRFCTDVLQMDTLPEEYVYMICKDNKGRLIGFFEVSHGTINASACDPRSIYQKALLCNAASIVVVHNHPSGDSTPSQDDVNAYERIKEAGKILGIRCAH